MSDQIGLARPEVRPARIDPRRHDLWRCDEKLIGPWTMRTMETVTHIVSRYFD